MENSKGVPQKIKNINIMGTSNFTFGYLSEGNKNTNSKRYVHLHVTAALFTIAKTWEQPNCPLMDEWINKMWYINI